jgi:hypothetical protein
MGRTCGTFDGADSQRRGLWKCQDHHLRYSCLDFAFDILVVLLESGLSSLSLRPLSVGECGSPSLAPSANCLGFCSNYAPVHLNASQLPGAPTIFHRNLLYYFFFLPGATAPGSPPCVSAPACNLPELDYTIYFQKQRLIIEQPYDDFAK